MTEGIHRSYDTLKYIDIDIAPLLLDGIKMSRADEIINRMTILVGQLVPRIPYGPTRASAIMTPR